MDSGPRTHAGAFAIIRRIWYNMTMKIQENSALESAQDTAPSQSFGVKIAAWFHRNISETFNWVCDSLRSLWGSGDGDSGIGLTGLGESESRLTLEFSGKDSEIAAFSKPRSLRQEIMFAGAKGKVPEEMRPQGPSAPSAQRAPAKTRGV